MKTAALLLTLLFVSLAVPLLISPITPLAGAAPAPADYPITVHVSSSRLRAVNSMELGVIISGKKYCLSGVGNGLLSVGDYKARLVKDEHRTSYQSVQTYELLYPDNKTGKYNVIGQSE